MTAAIKIRVLIVDDIAEMRENIRKLLAFENDIEVVAVAGSGQDAIDNSRKLQPNVILMDINMPGMDGITAAQTISQELPNAQVIMVSVQNEADYLRRAMLAGARDFVTKPFTAEELISTIRRVYKMSQARGQVTAVAAPTTPYGPLPGTGPLHPPRQGNIIATFGTKGGIGTSVMAVNLAVALCRQDRKVAIVDVSLHFGDVGVLLNLQATRSIADISKVISDLDAELIETMMTPHVSGIRALLAPTQPEMAELVTTEHIKSILEEMRAAYDYIVVDTNRSLKDEVLAVLDLADRIVLLGTADIPAIKNARTFFEVAEALAYPASKILYVLNKLDKRGLISPKDIETHIKHPVAALLPLDEVTAVSSVNKGVPFAADPRARNTALAQGVFQLAERLVVELTPVAEEPAAVAAPAETQEDLARKRLGRLFSRA